MKALTVKQPWASLIASGEKSIELRTWTTKYRGLVIITSAAGRSCTPDGRAVRKRVGDATPLGQVVCLVELLDVRPATPDDEQRAGCVPVSGEYAWELKLVAQLEGIPVKGKLQLWSADEQLVRAIEERLKGCAA